MTEITTETETETTTTMSRLDQDPIFDLRSDDDASVLRRRIGQQQQRLCRFSALCIYALNYISTQLIPYLRCAINCCMQNLVFWTGVAVTRKKNLFN